MYADWIAHLSKEKKKNHNRIRNKKIVERRKTRGVKKRLSFSCVFFFFHSSFSFSHACVRLLLSAWATHNNVGNQFSCDLMNDCFCWMLFLFPLLPFSSFPFCIKIKLDLFFLLFFFVSFDLWTTKPHFVWDTHFEFHLKRKVHFNSLSLCVTFTRNKTENKWYFFVVSSLRLRSMHPMRVYHTRKLLSFIEKNKKKNVNWRNWIHC